MPEVRPYVHPGVRDTSTTGHRLAIAIHQFTTQAAAIRERHLRGKSPDVRKALLRSALHWGTYLTGGEGGISFYAARREQTIVPDAEVGTPARRAAAPIIRQLRTSAASAEHGDATPSIWHRRGVIIAAHDFHHGHDGYFAFTGVKRVRSEQLAFLEIYMRVIEDSIRTFQRLEFARDQRHLLGRRTVLAQLRPNDLLYQALRRLHKYVPWRRSAFVLAPNMAETEPIVWHIAAERLSGVHAVSSRIGHTFKIRRNDVGELACGRLVNTLSDLNSDDPWSVLLHEVIVSAEGLPPNLAPARSAVITPISESAADLTLPFIVILTDPAEHHFDLADIRLTQEFFSDVGALLQRSSEMSKDLVRLWNPTESAPVGGNEEDPDRLEALPEIMLEPDTPLMLAVDSVQTVQFRRGTVARAASGSVVPLSFSAVERQSDERDHGLSRVMRGMRETSSNDKISEARWTRPNFQLLRGLNGSKAITFRAVPIWHALLSGQEVSIKDPKGISRRLIGNLYGPVPRRFIYRSALILPIRAEGETAGLLIAYRLSASEFTDIDKVLLRGMATRLGERIEFRRHMADHARLAACVSEIASASTEVSARNTLVHGAKTLLNADHSFLMACSQTPGDGTPMIAPVAHTWQHGSMHVPRLVVTEGITGHVFTTGLSIAADDVATNPHYRPLRDKTGNDVIIASELAVAVTVPLSQDEISSTVFGVLDVFWKLPHKIAPHEIKTLELLGRHAGAVLRLAEGRRSLQVLLRNIKQLELATRQENVFRWIDRNLISPQIDLVVVWSQRVPGSVVEIRSALGDKDRAEQLRAIRQPTQADGWIGSVIRDFRSGTAGVAVDLFDQPSPARRQIAGTAVEDYQTSAAYCFRPYARSAARQDRDAVWAITMYRFSPRNFDDEEKALFSLAAGAVANALKRIAYTSSASRLANASERIHALLAEAREDHAAIVRKINRTLYEELAAHSICIIRYANAGELPTRDTFPLSVTDGTPPARLSGLSERIRRHGRIIQFDRYAAPDDLKEAIDTSEFLQRHADIESVVAIPLFDDATNPPEFAGVLYVNLPRSGPCTTLEMNFIERMARIIIRCGRIAPKVAHMHQKFSEHLQRLTDPSQVYGAVLSIALNAIQSDIAERRQTPFDIVGDLHMLNRAGGSGPCLRQRASVGEPSGAFPTVLRINEGIIGEVARTGIPIVISNTSNTANYVPYFRSMKSEMAVPILFREPYRESVPGVAGDLIGVLNVECSVEDVFTDQHKRFLANYLTVPVSSLLHLAESHQLTLHDQRRKLDEMVSDAAVLLLHDLKAPIRALGLSAAELRKKFDNVNPGEVNELLGNIEMRVAQFDKAASSGFSLLSTDTYANLNAMDVVEPIREWAFNHSPKVEFKAPLNQADFIIERGHEWLVRTVLGNLYINSRNAGERTGRDINIWIDCVTRDHNRRSEYMQVHFNDDGPGVHLPPEDWPRLFHILKPKEERGSGWGIGLPVSKRMMQVMDGDLDLIKSVPDVVTTFRLTFKARPE